MILICGKACSGKNFLCDQGEKQFECLKRCVSHTTRPKREGEVEGVDYFFVSNEEFEEKIDHDEFVEYEVFNKWYYGTTKKEWFSSNMSIKTPSGIKKVLENKTLSRPKCVVYLDISEQIRFSRMMERQDFSDNITRRMNADKQDFKVFDSDWPSMKYDLRVTAPDFEPIEVLKFAMKLLKM